MFCIILTDELPPFWPFWASKPAKWLVTPAPDPLKPVHPGTTGGQSVSSFFPFSLLSDLSWNTYFNFNKWWEFKILSAPEYVYQSSAAHIWNVVGDVWETFSFGGGFWDMMQNWMTFAKNKKVQCKVAKSQKISKYILFFSCDPQKYLW